MITNSFGPRYLFTQPGKRTVTPYYAIKRLKSGSWLIYEGKGGQQVGVVATRLRACYVASVLNGWVKDRFNFGDLL